MQRVIWLVQVEYKLFGLGRRLTPPGGSRLLDIYFITFARLWQLHAHHRQLRKLGLRSHTRTCHIGRFSATERPLTDHASAIACNNACHRAALALVCSANFSCAASTAASVCLFLACACSSRHRLPRAICAVDLITVNVHRRRRLRARLGLIVCMLHFSSLPPPTRKLGRVRHFA